MYHPVFQSCLNIFQLDCVLRGHSLLITCVILCRCIMEKGVFNKLWSLLQWAIFSFAALGMFAISLVRIFILKENSTTY